MAAPVALLGPNIKWYVNNACGVAAVGGYIETSSSVTGAPQPTYNSAFVDATTQNPTVIRISSDGASEFPLYWAVGDGFDPYTIKEFDASGTLITQLNNYDPSTGGSGGTINVSINTSNYGRNEQFAFWNNGTSFTNDLLPVGTTPVADSWFFTRTNQLANITISQYNFAAGSPDYPFSPTSALRYTVTTASGDGVSDVSQRYDSVQTLNNRQITVVIRGQSLQVGQTAPVELIITQNFGTGGSLPVSTSVGTYTFDDTPNSYSSTFTVPNIAGKTIGMAGDDYLEIGFRFAPIQTQDLIITSYQVQNGVGTGIFYPYETENDQYVRIFPGELAGQSTTQGTNLVGKQYWGTLENFLDGLEKTNFLIGWDFKTNPNQMGQAIPSCVSGSYIADQTILISDGNGVVSKNSFIGSPLSLTVLTPAKKFGIFQIIETINSSNLSGKIVSACASVSSSSSLAFKLAIVKWTGSQDMQARNVWLSANAAGINPTLVAGWDYQGSPISFTSSTSTQEVLNKLENITLDVASSYGAIIWNDGADGLTGGSVEFHAASLTIGNSSFVPQTLPFSDVLSQCQRYFSRTYSYLNTQAVGTIKSKSGASYSPVSYSQNGTQRDYYFPFPFGGPVGEESGLFSSSLLISYEFPVEMYRAPIVSFYNPETGAVSSAQRYDEVTGVAPISGSYSVSVSSDYSDTKKTNLFISNGEVNYQKTATNGEFLFPPVIFVHIVANSQIGV